MTTAAPDKWVAPNYASFTGTDATPLQQTFQSLSTYLEKINNSVTIASGVGVLSAVAGTGISVSSATGDVTFTNTGVTSLTGTTNQITVSASTGAVTLSLPANITLSGKITTNNGFGAANSLITLGGWSSSTGYGSIESNLGYVLLGSNADNSCYFRTKTAAPIYIGANGNNCLAVASASASVTGDFSASGYGAFGGSGVTDAGSVSTPSWFRSTGNSGWYQQTYGGGIWMTDTTWVRTYNSKNFYCDQEIRAGANFSKGVDYAVYAGTTLTSFPFSGAYYITKSSSSRKLKHEIADLEDGTSLLKQLRPRTYKWNPKPDGDEIHKALTETKLNYGFIAEEVADVSKNIAHFTPPNPEWWDKEITLESFDEWEVEMWDVNAVVSITVKSVQELLARIETLENQMKVEQ